MDTEVWQSLKDGKKSISIQGWPQAQTQHNCGNPGVSIIVETLESELNQHSFASTWVEVQLE